LRRFTVDETKCVGCRICELACSFQHKREFDPQSARIRLYFADAGAVVIEVGACDCTRPLCIELCPVQALRPTLLCSVLNNLYRVYSGLLLKLRQAWQ
jgi:anaerobic carbon-monoxide dehydrogenase iron sulfur subunit